jgi:hypothetical protein
MFFILFFVHKKIITNFIQFKISAVLAGGTNVFLPENKFGLDSHIAVNKDYIQGTIKRVR